MISLLAASAGLSSKLVPPHDFAVGCRCRVACVKLVSSLSPFGSQKRNHEKRQAWAAAALSPKLVSLHDFALG